MPILCYHSVMKKIFVLLGLFLVIQCSALAAENVQLSGGIKMSDLKVFNEDGLFGLQDKQGNIIVKPEYKKLVRVGTTSWIAQKKNRFGLMDCEGNFLIEPKYRHVERVLGKYVKLGNDNDFGLYDETGKVIIPPEYSSIDLLYGRMFLTCKKYKYGIIDFDGNVILDNLFDDIYMPDTKSLRVQYEGEWYQIEKSTKDDIELPDNVKKVMINVHEFKVTHLVTNSGVLSGYYTLTAMDYILKLLSSISPAYEQTIDELMLSQGADTVEIYLKFGWIPKFPFTYAKKYYQNLRNPNNGPLAGVKNNLKRQIK